jgi:hypothetical protein
MEENRETKKVKKKNIFSYPRIGKQPLLDLLKVLKGTCGVSES